MLGVVRWGLFRVDVRILKEKLVNVMLGSFGLFDRLGFDKFSYFSR